MTLNKEKCVFKVKEVTYIGHKLTQEGINPDDEKVRAIKDIPAPTDKKGLDRLLGTVNYLGKFIPNLASVTEPIRVLRRKDIEFQWSHGQDKAFQEIKSVLNENGGPVLKFFDVQKPSVTISCNASPTGRGGVLQQDNCSVAYYASRSLTEAESTIGDKIVETLYLSRVTSENKRIRTPPLSPPFKAGVFVVFYR